MASLTASASPTMLTNLKKRSRHLSNDAFDFDYDVPRTMKRYRPAEAATPSTESPSDPADLPRFTARQLEYWEQHKLAEIARIRTECEHLLLKQNAELQKCHAELARVANVAHATDVEVARLQHENKLLKRAVAIQNQQKEECAAENQRFREVAVGAAEHIKRLEQTNYALRVHLQTSTQSSFHGSSPPSHLPDVF